MLFAICDVYMCFDIRALIT